MPKILATTIVDDLLQHFAEVRYVALLQQKQLYAQQKNGINNSSASESDKYEELFVNPTLLTLTTQRGNLDCGGLNWLMVRYGNFYQLILPLPEGHLSVCLALHSNLEKIPKDILDFVAQYEK